MFSNVTIFLVITHTLTLVSLCLVICQRTCLCVYLSMKTVSLRNLIALISTATLGELNSMEVLVAELVNSKVICVCVFTEAAGVLILSNKNPQRYIIVCLQNLVGLFVNH